MKPQLVKKNIQESLIRGMPVNLGNLLFKILPYESHGPTRFI